MLIVKGGISREIEEKNLQEYIDKGYALVGAEPIKTDKDKPKRAPKG